jgi:predicted small secreted protein
MRQVFLLSFLSLFIVTTILGCANTMRGAGKDIHKAGESMEKI